MASEEEPPVLVPAHSSALCLPSPTGPTIQFPSQPVRVSGLFRRGREVEGWHTGGGGLGQHILDPPMGMGTQGDGRGRKCRINNYLPFGPLLSLIPHP